MMFKVKSGRKLGFKHSDTTKKKIGDANRNRVHYNCDYCGLDSSDKPSSYKKKKRHFCSNKCYHLFRKHKLPKEEQNRFGSGLAKEEREKRVKARSILNHYLRDKKIERPGCEVCGNEKSEAHHDDYTKPLEVKWLCLKHHRLYHKIGDKIYQNPELITPSS